jgi:hypothetical protein
MHQNDPIVHLWSDLLGNLVQPYKGYRDKLPETATKEAPLRIPKCTLTTRWYDCWREEDGSYHESFVQEHTQSHE